MEPKGAAEETADEYFKNKLPKEYRFRPTDECLVVDYLKNKVLKKPMPLHAIKTCNIYRSHPSELFGGDNPFRVNERYFFTPKERMYPNGSRPDRIAGNGFWKATGEEFPIKSEGAVVGFKNTLAYYEGNPRGTPVKTTWLMEEFRLNPEFIPEDNVNNNIVDECVLVKIYNNDSNYRKREASPSPSDEDEDERRRYILNSRQLPDMSSPCRLPQPI